MPSKRTAQQREPQPHREPDEAAPSAERPRLEPAEDDTVETERPYRVFVESRLSQYLRDNNVRSLIKPTREEIRAAAMPIPPSGVRHPGSDQHNQYNSLNLFNKSLNMCLV